MLDSFSFNQLQIQPYREDLEPKKMDVLFYDSINRLKRSYSLGIMYHALKGLMMVVFIPIDEVVIQQPNNERILAVMIFALLASVLQIVSLTLFRCTTLKNIRLILNIATQMNHVTNQNITQNIDSLENCVSTTMYHQQNQTLVTDEGLTEQLKNMYTNFLTSNVKEILVKSSEYLKLYDYFAQFSGFVCMFTAIAVLITSEENTAELVVLIVYIFMEGFTKIFILFIFLMLFLSPLLCLFAVFCVCCCRSQEFGETKLPPSQKATQKMIAEADGTCSICYQNFIVTQDVVRLKCSPKHMFHPFCISGWTKLKATCPICRASIRDADKNPGQNNN